MTGNIDQGGHLAGSPINLTQYNPEQLAELAGKIDSPFRKDVIIGQLEMMQVGGISLGQSSLDRLEAGHPVLTTPEAHTLLSSNLTQVMNAIGTNKFLAPNVLASFIEMFLKMAAEMTKAGLHEAELAGKSIVARMDLASVLADLAKETAKLEAIGHFVAAVASAIKVATNIGSVAALSKIAGPKKGPDGKVLTTPDGKAVMPSDAEVMRKQQSIKGYTEIATGLTDIAKSIADGVLALKRGDVKAAEEIAKTMASAQEQVLSSAKEAYRGLAEMFTQTLQLLQKLIDANTTANNSLANK